MGIQHPVFEGFGVTVTSVALTTKDGTISLATLLGVSSKLRDESDDNSRSYYGQIEARERWGTGIAVCVLLWSFWTGHLKNPGGLMLLVKWVVAGGFWVCLVAWCLCWLGQTRRSEDGSIYAEFQLSFPDGMKAFHVRGPYLDFETRKDFQKKNPLVDSFHQSMGDLAQALSTIADSNRTPR